MTLVVWFRKQKLEKKLADHNDKNITTPEFNTLADSVFNVRLAHTNLITKTDFDAKLSSYNRKITSYKTKLLLAVNELKKLKKFDWSCFIGKSHFQEHGTKNYLVFQRISRYFKGVINSDYILSWISKGLSDENITLPSAPHSFLNPSLSNLGTKTRVRFSGSCLKKDTIKYNY